MRSQGEISLLLFYVSSVASMLISRRVRYQLQLMKQYFFINCGLLFERTTKETKTIGALIFPSINAQRNVTSSKKKQEQNSSGPKKKKK